MQYFNLSGLRVGDIEQNCTNYKIIMYAFVKAFVKISVCKRKLAYQTLSSLLTPSDEAFLQLCVHVYVPSIVNKFFNLVSKTHTLQLSTMSLSCQMYSFIFTQENTKALDRPISVSKFTLI